MKNLIIMLLAACFLFVFTACGDDPVPIQPDTDGEQEKPDDIEDDDGDTGSTGGDTGSTGTGGSTGTDTGTTGDTPDGCATEALGKACTTDDECGACRICISGKCANGCTDDDDCKMHQGLKCNKKLARCLNIFASTQACNEAKCPSGCCYADKGLQGLKCLSTPTPGTCGFCPQGDVYDGAKCIPGVCSTSTDTCPTLNSHEKYPVCWQCKSGEFICEEKKGPGGSQCSGVLISPTSCIPAGQQCVAGVSECCSGMPCVQGYCY